MRFEFATAGRILFGPGTFGESGKMARELGKCALVVCGSDSVRAQPILSAIEAANLKNWSFATRGEPTIEHIKKGVTLARQSGCNVVIGFGGGSVIDSAKAIAGLVRTPVTHSTIWKSSEKENRSSLPPCPASRFRPLQALELR